MNNRPEEYLSTNIYYNSKVVGECCEKRDPQLLRSSLSSPTSAEYVAVIAAANQAAANVELVHLQMCCKKAKESHIDTSLIFSHAKSEQFGLLEEFISAPNVDRIQDVAER